VEKPYTAENVYGVRIGANKNMDYYDKKEWDFDWRNKPYSFLTTAMDADTDKFLYVDNVRDFTGSGTVYCEGTSIGYTAKSNTGGTLTIDTTSGARGDYDCSVGSTVYQNVSHGLPDKFTVFANPGGSAYIYFNRPIDTAYIGQNVWLDHYMTIATKDSDADELDEPFYDMFVPYLEWKIKQRKNQGLNPLEDPSYQRWVQRKSQALKAEYGGVEIRISPGIDHLPIP